MAQLLDTAARILAISERRLDVSAQNIANSNTVGYKRRISFSGLLSPTHASNDLQATDFAAGKMNLTGAPLDLAITDDAFFVVRQGETRLYTRSGHFRRDAEGRLVTESGAVLQAEGGGDLTAPGGRLAVAVDGTVSSDGVPLARLALVRMLDRGEALRSSGGYFQTEDANVAPVATPSVQQGALETSNVDYGDEMVGMMEAMRRAETGQRLVRLYDDLTGRALTTFGRA